MPTLYFIPDTWGNLEVESGKVLTPNSSASISCVVISLTKISLENGIVFIISWYAISPTSISSRTDLAFNIVTSACQKCLIASETRLQKAFSPLLLNWARDSLTIVLIWYTFKIKSVFPKTLFNISENESC